MKAVIPAGGRGTRFLPAAKTTTNGNVTGLHKPTIQYVVEEVELQE